MTRAQSLFIVALDIDRTILDTTYFLEVIYEQCLLEGTSPALIDQLKHEEIASRGSSFDVISKLETFKVLPPLESMYQYADGILYDGVTELFSKLLRAQLPFILLTYGTGFAQSYKIELIKHAIGSALPFYITNEPNKAAWLERCKEGGVFTIPITNTSDVMRAERIILVDDKPSNLQAHDPDIHTVLVNNSAISEVKNEVAIAHVWDAIRQHILKD